ncbi:MAG: PKD domain-containing protein [Crocinitomicaceae bacterium]|nr:PKD domain-containing protein [Crocinitomicaceae bacterium]
MKKLNFLIVLFAVVSVVSCKKKDEPTLGDPPTAADAEFTYQPSTANPNIIEFTALNSTVQATWDLGNGLNASGTNVTGIYPNAGTYNVKLTVFTSGGSASTTQEVIIANSDPTLLDSPIYNALTGGAAGPGYKTWVIDSVVAAHFGVGPDPIGSAGYYPEWWAANPLDKAGVGLYDDRYTFHLNNFQFDMVNNGHVYVHNGLAGDFPGSYQNLNDYTAPYTDQLNKTWVVSEGIDTTITISQDAFIGMYTGVNTYKIINYSDTSLWLQYKHFDGGLHWYIRLIPEGFVSSGGGGPVATYELPIDCETVEPTFVVFGNSTATVIDNPDPSGINTSPRVIETVHGNETWAGFLVDLTTPLDFSTLGTIALKVWAPSAGVFRIKIENSSNTNDFVVLDVNVTTANAWEEIVVDFATAGALSNVYDRIVLFPGWDISNAGTFYVDDIVQQ